MKKIRTIIVDDEPEARQGLALLIANDPDLEIVDLCANGLEALEAIQEQRPDLLFLDIQMPKINGFELLNSLALHIRPEVIFTTAYDAYTLKAFEVHAVDYLLKPFSDSRLNEAIRFAKERIQHQYVHEQQQKIEKLLDDQKQEVIRSAGPSVISSKEQTNRLAIKSDGKVYLLPYNDIVWVEAFDYYVKIHVKGRFFLVRETMKNMEKNLSPGLFARIHKSSIINLDAIQELDKNVPGEVILKNGEILKVSRKYRSLFRDQLTQNGFTY